MDVRVERRADKWADGAAKRSGALAPLPEREDLRSLEAMRSLVARTLGVAVNQVRTSKVGA